MPSKDEQLDLLAVFDENRRPLRHGSEKRLLLTEADLLSDE
jgi:hypothetical protein